MRALPVRGLLDRRRSVIALWALAVLIAAGIAGYSFWPRDEPRDDVAAYILTANETGATFAAQYKNVTDAYRRLATGQPGQAAQLAAAAARLTELRKRLEAVEAPPEARQLRVRLLAFYRRQEEVARELAELTAFFGRLAKAETGLRAAATTMQAGLKSSQTPAAQAAALAAYGDAVQRAHDRVVRIPAGRTVVAIRTAEARRLARTSRSVDGVEAGLTAGDRAALRQAVARLASVGPGGAAATRAAIVAYNRHVAEIRRLAAAVERERQSLDRSL